MTASVSTARDEQTRPRERRAHADTTGSRSRKNSEYGLEEGLLLQVRCLSQTPRFCGEKDDLERISSNRLVILQVDIFLSELERRLDLLESYGNLEVDAGISRAYATLK